MSGLDGDHTGKTLDAGANSSINATDFTEGIHESAHQGEHAGGEKMTGHGTSVFDKQGALGKQFTTQGALGGTAQKVGGPFDKEGTIGKQFTTGGALGGTAQNLADKNQQH